jgi:hypothetical protein
MHVNFRRFSCAARMLSIVLVGGCAHDAATAAEEPPAQERGDSTVEVVRYRPDDPIRSRDASGAMRSYDTTFLVIVRTTAIPGGEELWHVRVGGDKVLGTVWSGGLRLRVLTAEALERIADQEMTLVTPRKEVPLPGRIRLEGDPNELPVLEWSEVKARYGGRPN